MADGAERIPVSRVGEGELCFFNGIDAATGEYLLPPMSPRQLSDLARCEPRYHLPDSPRRRPPRDGFQDMGPGEGVDPRDIGQSGWGVIFAGGVAPGIRAALAPLLAHRRGQASRERKQRYREMTHRPGESKTGFLARHGVPPGPADPDRMPYYLLLVGGPEEIPFEFQYQLDVQYAVGRIHFDSPEEYERYARTVVEAETGMVPRSRTAAFFAPRNAGDPLTAQSADELAAPLAEKAAEQLSGWSVQTVLGSEATKARLRALLAGDDRPALLFTAGHGLCFRSEDPRQPSLQGALVCQDWPGPGRPVNGEHYFSAGDVDKDAQVAGLLAFHFSCYGAGTPHRDDFPEPLYGRREIAPRAFLSQLARRLLTHPRGGALAVVGHVDRAWSWSFSGPAGQGHAFRPVFESALKRLAEGYPIGAAMEYFNICYAELASDLDGEVRRRKGRDLHIADLWTRRNDARNYAVLGDPAVRLAVAPPPPQQQVVA